MARVLVVEDEKDLREVLDYNLTKEGHRVQLVSTGAEGLRLARELQPELVLLDLMLPDMSGTEVCKTLKKEPATREIRVIMVTAKGEEIDRVVGFELGADDYVVKPFSVRELLLRVGAVLRRKDAPSARLRRVRRAAHRSRGAPGLGRRRRGDADHARVQAAAHALRAQEPRADALGAPERRLGHRGRHHDAHRRHAREAPAREAQGVGRYIETVRGVGYRFTEAPSDERSERPHFRR